MSHVVGGGLLFLTLTLITLSTSTRRGRAPTRRPTTVITRPTLQFNCFDFRRIFRAVPNCTVTGRGVSRLHTGCSRRAGHIRARFGAGCRRFLSNRHSCTGAVLRGHRTRLHRLVRGGVTFGTRTTGLLDRTRASTCTPLGTRVGRTTGRVNGRGKFTFVVGASGGAAPCLDRRVNRSVATILRRGLG